jgi:hypothetical protein
MIYKDDLNNIVLEHHGVKGQHWGVRKRLQKFGSDIKKVNATANKANAKIDASEKRVESKSQHEYDKIVKNHEALKKRNWTKVKNAKGLKAKSSAIVNGLISNANSREVKNEKIDKLNNLRSKNSDKMDDKRDEVLGGRVIGYAKAGKALISKHANYTHPSHSK